MKGFIIGLVLLLIAGAGLYFWSPQAKPSPSTSAVITRIGMLKKSSIKDADFTHMIVAEKESWGVMSQTIKLDDYVGKKVEAKGQNSGTTLYIDSITVLP